MENIITTYPADAKTFYTLLHEQLTALLDPSLPQVSNLANASALLFYALRDINWAGFYLMHQGALVLGPFQGKVACTRIAIGKGVCGTAVSENHILCVPDVHAFPGYIACDSASNSEIVLPLHDASGNVAAVLDIDSPQPARFGSDDVYGLDEIARLIEEAVFIH